MMELIEINENNRKRIQKKLRIAWGSSYIVTQGVRYNTGDLPGFVYVEGKQIQGILTYRIKKTNCEIISLNAFKETLGIGTALLDALHEKLKEYPSIILFLFTTNDNLDALRFWQRRNFRITDIYPFSVTISRSLKPDIPATGNYGIPIRDEIKLEYIKG